MRAADLPARQVSRKQMRAADLPARPPMTPPGERGVSTPCSEHSPAKLAAPNRQMLKCPKYAKVH